MPTRQRILIGTLGGLVPTALNALVVDPTTVFSDPGPYAVLAWLLRVIVLCALGALVAWLHRNESDPAKLIQLGIMAPALLTAGLNGGVATSNVNNSRLTPFASLIQPSTAWAQDEDEIFSFEKPRETSGQAFWRGFTGIRSHDRWFIIVGEGTSERNAAVKAAAYIREKFKLDARVFQRQSGRDPAIYYVVLQSWLDSGQVERAKQGYEWTKLDVAAIYAP